MTDSATPSMRLLAAPRRLRPSDLRPAVPVLRSHTAGWRDLVVLDDSHLEPRHAPPLPVDWDQRWTLTTRRRSGDATVSVDELSWRTVQGANPMLVANWHPNTTARAGLQYMSGTGRHHSFQSSFERRFLIAADFHGVVGLTSQPFLLEWFDGSRWRRHTPDFAVRTHDGPLLVNVRPLARLNDAHRQKTAALAAVAARAGWQCRTVVGYRMPALPIVTACAAARGNPDRLGITGELAAALADGPQPWHRAVSATSCEPFARAVLRSMVWHRQASIDLNRNLNDATVVSGVR